MTRRGPVVLLTAAMLGVILAGCAGAPAVDPGARVEATAVPPAVLAGQAQQVRDEVAGRLQIARAGSDPALVERAAVGPVAELELLRAQVDGPQAAAEAPGSTPAAVLVAPRTDTWPRWFMSVTDPAVPDPAADDPAVPDPAADNGLPTLELYSSSDVRSPYRMWGRLSLLPGAVLPAFPDPGVGAASLADGTGPDLATPDDADVSDEEDAEPPENEELQGVLDDLSGRYASVLADGDASPAAAEFEPDAFVEGVRARSEAERAATAGVARTTVIHSAYGDGEVLYAVAGADGDVLAVTAVQTVTSMTVQPGAGVLQPDAEVRAAAGIEETDGTLTTRSVAALAFVVPAESGAIRLVAVGEGLVAAEAS